MEESSHCGVGFLATLKKNKTHDLLANAITCLERLEHRGGVNEETMLGDGAGLMLHIPWEIFDLKPDSAAVASLYISPDPELAKECLQIFENVFSARGLKIIGKRDVPVDKTVISPIARESLPDMINIFISRPEHCRTLSSFEKLLYMAKRQLCAILRDKKIKEGLTVCSLSARTIIYKVLGTSFELKPFYLDLQDKRFKTGFALFHRRFSTNTRSGWDKVQPFTNLAHNGEFNTFEGNKTWAMAREQALGLQNEELITKTGVSDSFNLNEMVQALKFRSAIISESEIFSLLMPPSRPNEPYYRFWSRALEPWDGPALVCFSCGKMAGARLDRNGFRPARWAQTEDYFLLASEAGLIDLDSNQIVAKGSLKAGDSIRVNLYNGKIYKEDPCESILNKGVTFNPRNEPLTETINEGETSSTLYKRGLYGLDKESLLKIINPMIKDKKDPVGSMGDTARLACLSDLNRSLFDYFYQKFAQVTNPPLDYIREKSITDLRITLGRSPNIFNTKEMLPLRPNYELDHPIISLGQRKTLENLSGFRSEVLEIQFLSTLFNAKSTTHEFLECIEEIAKEAVRKVKKGATVLVLSDYLANEENIPLPSVLVLRAVHSKLIKAGIRLRTSIVIDSGEIFTPHHVAVLAGMGADAVCPYVYLEIARYEQKTDDPKLSESDAIKTMAQGLLKIMAKMGISVYRSFIGTELFDIIGLSEEVHKKFFPRKKSLFGGVTFNKIHAQYIERVENKEILPSPFLTKESPSKGEVHAITTKESKVLIQTLNEKGSLRNFLNNNKGIHLKDFFQMKKGTSSNTYEDVPLSEILASFGTGAMSFGAISAKAQRDLIVAMKEIGGRSNSGEGGENPFYYTEGTSATIKQIASGRFGVTAEYLVTGDEIQIKIAQGAKPGEGGQLPGSKVGEEIAKARFASVGTALISPPPMHDIYSIEDLKELIYELKQLHKEAKVSVKLVSALNIGPIAVGVAKAGADIIVISGGNGGTGAASMISMRHTGLPWEIGLTLAHRALWKNSLRHRVTLRTDGGLQTADDVILASILGAEEFDFGKIALIAQGCIMARVCHKNTCPAGIATQDPKFQARYKGTVENVVYFFKSLAKEVQTKISGLGISEFQELVGRTSFIEMNPLLKNNLKEKGVDLSFFLEGDYPLAHIKAQAPPNISHLNKDIFNDYENADSGFTKEYEIHSTQRAVPAYLIGQLAKSKNNSLQTKTPFKMKKTSLNFKGTAGQGFGIFLHGDMELNLSGEANDFVGKGMNGGTINIRPDYQTPNVHKDTIIGNCALYGATGGKLIVHGVAGERFAVRNSGAFSIIYGAGMHACEYMTGGEVISLGEMGENIGAGMSGGRVFILKSQKNKINFESACLKELDDNMKNHLEEKLKNNKINYDSSIIDNMICVIPSSLAEQERLSENEQLTRPEG